MEIKKDDSGKLRAVLKEVAIKDWKDPYHEQCPMRW